MIAAVTIDAAGTLIAPHPGVGLVYAEVAAAHGLVVDAVALEAGFPAAFASVREAWGVPYGQDEADARRFWSAVVERTFARPLPQGLADALYDTFAGPARWRVLPGAAAALRLIAARGLPCAVVSNFDGRLHGLLPALGLGPIATVVVSSQVGAAKPDPAPLREAARRLGVAPSSILHLGDSRREDGGMCQAAGCAWFAVDPMNGIDLARLADALAGCG